MGGAAAAAGRLLLAWTRQEGATCMDLESREEVRDAYLRRTRSISPTGLSLPVSLPIFQRGWGARTGQPRPGSSKGKKKRRETTTPNIITPTERERGNSFSFERLETRRLLVQSLLFISQRHNHTEYFFDYLFPPPPSPMINTCRPLLHPAPSLPRRPPCVVWFSAAGAPRDKVSRARWRGFVRPGSVGITYITLTRSGFEYCSGSWVIRVPFVGKMGSRDGGE